MIENHHDVGAKLDEATEALTSAVASLRISEKQRGRLVAAISRLAVAHRMHALAAVSEQLVAAEMRRPIVVCLERPCAEHHERG